LYRRPGEPQIQLGTCEEEYCLLECDAIWCGRNLPLLQWNLQLFNVDEYNFCGCGLPFFMCHRCAVEIARTPKSYSARLPKKLVAIQNICVTTGDQVIISSPPASKYIIYRIFSNLIRTFFTVLEG
jgi:hypothetical protein